MKLGSRAEFPLSQRDHQKLEQIANFIILLYARYFLSSRLSTAAPRLDLSFWYDLQRYKQLQPRIAHEVKASVKRHLWYLCPELVVLGLFDDELSDFEKEQMASQLLQTPRPAVYQPGKPGQPDFQPVAALLLPERPSLSVFITERSWLIFHLLDIDMPRMQWISLPPSSWLQDDTYCQLHEYLRDMQVVNDAAERAVKDVAEYAHMTQAPGDRDNVILVATDHRGRVSDLRKPNLNRV